MPKNKLDLFSTLDALGRNNGNLFSTLSEDEQKAFSPITFQKWLSSGGDKETFFLNELVNPFVFTLGGKHKELLFRLMSICGSGKKKRYRWTPPKTVSTSLRIAVIKEYFKYSNKEAAGVLDILKKNDIIDLAEQLGYDDIQISNLRKEFNEKRNKKLSK